MRLLLVLALLLGSVVGTRAVALAANTAPPILCQPPGGPIGGNVLGNRNPPSAGFIGTAITGNYSPPLNGSAALIQANPSTIVKNDPCSANPNNYFIVTPCAGSVSLCGTGSISTTAWPEVQIYNSVTQTTAAGPTVISNVNSDSYAGHDSPQIAAIAYGCPIVAHGAAMTASGGAPGSAAFSSSGNTGSYAHAQSATWGCNLNVATDVNSFLCTSACNDGTHSNSGFLPTVGLSEMSSRQDCTVAGCHILACGQVQQGTSYGVASGDQACIQGRITGPGINGISWFTQCGWQPITTVPSALCNAAVVPVHAGLSDMWQSVALSSVPTTGTFTIEPSGVGCASAITVTSGATATLSIIAAAAAFNGSAGTAAGCNNTGYKMYAPTASYLGCTATTCLGIGDESQDPALDSTTPAAWTCTTIVCGSRIAVPLTYTGDSLHFSYGGLLPYSSGYFYLLGDTQPAVASWLGSVGNSNALNFWLTRIALVDSGGMTITDATGANGRTVTLNSTAQVNYKMNGSGGGGTCTGSCASGTAPVTEPGAATVASWCTIGCTDSGTVASYLLFPCASVPTNYPANGTAPFSYDYNIQTQVTQAASTAGLATSFHSGVIANGKANIFYSGQDANGHEAIFDIAVSLSNRQTTCTTVATGGTSASRYNIAVTGYVGPSGTLYAIATIPNGSGWSSAGFTSAAGTNLAYWSSTDNGATWSTGTRVYGGGGTNSSAFTGQATLGTGGQVNALTMSGACTTLPCNLYFGNLFLP